MKPRRETRLFLISLLGGVGFTFLMPIPNSMLPMVPWAAGLTLGPFIMVLIGATLALIYRKAIDYNRLMAMVMAAFFLLYLGIQIFSCPYFRWVGRQLGRTAQERMVRTHEKRDVLLETWLKPRVLYPKKKPAKACLLEGYKEGQSLDLLTARK